MSARLASAAVAGFVLTLAGAMIPHPSLAFADSARSPSSAAKPPAVISLGDSFISGEAGRWKGNGNTKYPGSRYGTDLAAYSCNAGESWCWHDPKRSYGSSYDNGCHRSVGAEIEHVQRVSVGGREYNIDEENRINVACSGATTDSIYKNSFKGEPKQVDQLANQARGKDIKLVILSIGGNDIKFSGIIQQCVTAFTKGGEHCNKKLGPELPGRIAQMETEVKKTVDAIRDTMANAGYQDSAYRLVLQSYPSPIPRSADNRYPDTDWSRWTQGGCPFFNDDSDWAHGTIVPDIANAHERVAKDKNLDYLDLRNALDGHEVCAKGAKQAGPGNTLRNLLPEEQSEWARWIDIPRTGQGQTQEFMHPNFYGQQELGDCLNTIAASAEPEFSCDNTPA